MKIIISVLSVIAIFVASLYDNNYFASPNKILWSDSLTLNWSNFDGLQPIEQNYSLQTTLKKTEHITFLAMTITDITYSSKGNNYDVQAVFYAGRSFYKMYYDTVKLSDNILRHELYHFHMTELFARYMRKDLAMLEKPSPVDVYLLHARHTAKLDSASDAYDKFTRHSYMKVNQKQAERMIDSLLLIMDSYKRIQ